MNPIPDPGAGASSLWIPKLQCYGRMTDARMKTLIPLLEKGAYTESESICLCVYPTVVMVWRWY
jgi:hypothetical protein